MRNEPKPLSPEDYAVQSHALRVLRDRSEATLHYTKRDGKTSRSSGTIQFFNGKPGFDTGSVTIEDTVKGPRTINLHRITFIE